MKAKELSCKDLMVGDLVSYHGIVNKVAPADFCHEKWLEEIKPIPLTPEILEKNGFRITFEGELHKTYFQDIDGFAVEIKIDCIGFTKLSMSNGLGYKVVVECKHVYKLQHAMRIMGCDKEIEL